MKPPCPPFSPCWCEIRPEHPRCQNQPQEVTINNYLLFILILLLTFKFFKNYEKN